MLTSCDREVRMLDKQEDPTLTSCDLELEQFLEKNLVIQKRCESPVPAKLDVASLDSDDEADFPSTDGDSEMSETERLRGRIDMIMNAVKAGRSRVLSSLLSPNPEMSRDPNPKMLLHPNPEKSRHRRSSECFREIINLPDPLGFTPLMQAAYCGHQSCLRVLLRHKADPNLVAKDNSTALHLASQHGFGAAIKILLKHGANYNPIDHLRKLFALG